MARERTSDHDVGVGRSPGRADTDLVAQQKKLLPLLPDHLARMALFVLNTGVRDDVVCNLQWEWEIRVPELGVSVFEVPRLQAGLGDLHVHDLRHTVGMRLREAGVAESTVADVLWHSTRSMTHHYSVAQIVELHGALELIKEDTGQWNKSLATLRAEQEATNGTGSPPKVPHVRKTAYEPELVSR